MTTVVSVAQGGTGSNSAALARTALGVPPSAAYDQANTARDQANTARTQANSAYAQANSAYSDANTRLSASGGTLAGNLIITGNLTVSGNSTTLNTEILTVEDADVVLLSNVASTPALNAGIIVNRGTSTNTFLRWNEVTDRWGWSDDGTTFVPFANAVLETGDTMTGNLTFSGATLNTATANISTIITGNALTISTGTASNGNIIFSANGTEDMRITAPGNVGIGTNSPLSLLHLSSTAAATRITVTDDVANGRSGYIESNFSNAFVIGTTSGVRSIRFAPDNTTRMTIDVGTGNVGIGNTNPATTLHVDASGGGIVRVSRLGTGAGILQMEADGTDGTLTTTNIMKFVTNSAERMRLDTSGNLFLNAFSGRGGGSTGYIFKLNPGKVYFEIMANNTTMQSDILFTDGASGAYGIVGYDHSNDSLRIYTNSAERLTITSSGNLGIGTTAPYSSLHLAGDLTMGSGTNARPALKITNWGYSSSYRALLIGSSNTTYTTANTGAVTVCFNYDPSINGNGAFSGDGREIIFRRGTRFVTPNSSDNAYNLTNLVLYDSSVGIGTDAPGSKLHLYDGSNPLSLTIQRTTVPVFLSDVQLASTTAAASWSHNMKDTSNASESWSAFTNTAYAGSAIRLVADTSTSQIRFMTATAANSNPSERIRITGSGGLVLGSDASGTHVQFSAVKTGISDSTTTSLFRIKSNSNQIYGFLEIHYALDDPGNQSYDGRVAYRVFHNGGTTLLDSITSESYSTVPTFSGTASGGNFDISINFNSGATTYKVAYYVTFTCHDNSQSVINVEEL